MKGNEREGKRGVDYKPTAEEEGERRTRVKGGGVCSNSNSNSSHGGPA